MIHSFIFPFRFAAFFFQYHMKRTMPYTNNKPSLYLGIPRPLFIYPSRCMMYRFSYFFLCSHFWPCIKALHGDQMSVMCFFTDVFGTHTIVLIQINSRVSRGSPILFSWDNMLSFGIVAVLIGLLSLLKDSKGDEDMSKLEDCGEEDTPSHLWCDDENENDHRGLERRRKPNGRAMDGTTLACISVYCEQSWKYTNRIRILVLKSRSYYETEMR